MVSDVIPYNATDGWMDGWMEGWREGERKGFREGDGRKEGGKEGMRDRGREGWRKGEMEGWKKGGTDKWVRRILMNFELTWNRNNLEGGVESSSCYGIIRPELHSNVFAARLDSKRRHIAAVSIDVVSRSKVRRPFLRLVTHV